MSNESAGLIDLARRVRAMMKAQEANAIARTPASARAAADHEKRTRAVVDVILLAPALFEAEERDINEDQR